MCNDVIEIIQDGSSTTVGVAAEAGPQGPPGTTDFTQLQNVPPTFPPSAHTHIASEISDSTTAGRALLTAGTALAQRQALGFTADFPNLASFPATGELNKSYLALDTRKTYVWSGISYIEISPNTHTRSGIGNVNVGETALSSASLSGTNNTGVGADALTANTTGGNNIAIGTAALSSNISGNGNVAVGKDALKNCNSPDANISIGQQAGDTIESGGSNIIIGHEADVDSSWRQRCIVLGRSAISPATDGSLAIGGTGGNVMGNLVSETSGGTSANKDLIIYLNGTRYLIALKQ
jgi:hypothetical protein